MTADDSSPPQSRTTSAEKTFADAVDGAASATSGVTPTLASGTQIPSRMSTARQGDAVDRGCYSYCSLDTFSFCAPQHNGGLAGGSSAQLLGASLVVVVDLRSRGSATATTAVEGQTTTQPQARCGTCLHVTGREELWFFSARVQSGWEYLQYRGWLDTRRCRQYRRHHQQRILRR